MLTFDLIDGVINVIIGERVRCYRSKYLTRLNDVRFRKVISVKCEKKELIIFRLITYNEY